MWIHPSIFFFVGAALAPFLRGRVRSALLISLSVLAAADVVLMPSGIFGVTHFAGQPVIFGRVDGLSLVFANIFTIIAVIGVIYALHVKSVAEPSTAFLYIGGALGAVFAGDILSLFLFWEIMALASTGLIWCGGNRAAGMRYLMMHLAGGVCLILGIVIHRATGHDLFFDAFVQEGVGLGAGLILIGFLVNAAAPPLHAWLSDAYPAASVSGTVFLSAFTTKTAVYVLVRGFAGYEPLVALGVVMTLYGVVYAMIENDIRRLLAYHIISQVGFMIAGVGIGTPLAINGAVAHAFAHILYKALLMMGMGSVIFMTGRSRGTELGGLWRAMPLTCLLYLIGGVSISGVPFFSGFVSKSMVISAAHETHRSGVFLLLTLASCGTFLSTTLKLPRMVFFGPPREDLPNVTDPPRHMLIAMSAAAILCVVIGLNPGLLYRLLPYPPIDYQPYTLDHLVGSLQLLLATAAIFLIFLPRLAPHAVVNLDFERLYSKIGAATVTLAAGPVARWEAVLADGHDRWVIRPVRALTLLLREVDAQIIDGAVRDVAKGVAGGSRLSNLFEKYIVYAFINLLGYLHHIGAGLFRKLQTGSVHHYAMILIVGIFLLVNGYLLWSSGLEGLLSRWDMAATL